jgi:hypothetical protein
MANIIVKNPRSWAELQGIQNHHGCYLGIPRTGYGLKVEEVTSSPDAVFAEDRLWFVRNRSGVLHAVMAKRAQEARVLVDDVASCVG